MFNEIKWKKKKKKRKKVFMEAIITNWLYIAGVLCNGSLILYAKTNYKNHENNLTTFRNFVITNPLLILNYKLVAKSLKFYT